MIWIATAEPGLYRALSAALPEATVLLLGEGAQGAAAALERAAAAGPLPAWLLHAGLAAAIQPGVPAGTLVFDVWGQDAQARDAAKEVAAELGFPYQLGRIVSADPLPVDRRSFGLSHRAAAVDLENDAVRDWAKGRSVPFLAVEAVQAALEPVGWPRLLRAWSAQRVAGKRLVGFLSAYTPRLTATAARA